MSYQASHRPLNDHSTETNAACHDYLIDEAGKEKDAGSVTEHAMMLSKQSKLATTWTNLWKTPSTMIALFLLGWFFFHMMCAKFDSI
jgi:hypothetical protein